MRARYGSGPGHLVGHLALFGVVALIVAQLLDARAPWNILFWFVGAALLHDLFVLPLYTAIDRGVFLGSNYLRVPAAFSALLLLVWFPTILDRNDRSFGAVAGEAPSGQLGRWLIVTVALFAISAAVAAVRARRPAARPHRSR